MAVKIKACLAVVGGILIHLTIGTLYCWGNINPYVTSYIRKHSHPATLRYGDTVWVFAMAVTGQGLSMFLGGILERKIGTRLATLTGCITTSLGVFLSAFTVQVSYYLFLLTYGFMFGVGIGVTYAPPLAVAMNWFPEHKGVANGFIVAGFGGGAFIFDQIQTAYLNPQNVKAVGADHLNTTQDIGNDKYFVDESVLSKVPSMFMILGGCYFAMQLLGVVLLFPPLQPAENRENEYLFSSDEEDNTPQTNRSKHLWNMPSRHIIRQKPFITLWFMFLLNALCVIFISTLYKTYGEAEVVNDDSFLTLLGAFAAIFNAVGRILWGLYADKASFKVAIVSLCAAMTCLMGSLYITHLLADVAGKPLLFIWICLIFLSFSGNFSLFPTAIAKTFGPKFVSVNYGLLFTSSAVAGPIGALLSTLLLQKLHSYGLFILSACMSFVALILGLTFDAVRPDGRPV